MKKYASLLFIALLTSSFQLSASEITIEEVPKMIGGSMSFGGSDSLIIAYRCDGKWLSSIIEDFCGEDVKLVGTEHLPVNEDNSSKSYKVIIPELPREKESIRDELFALISEEFNLSLEFKTEEVAGYIFDFSSHSIPLIHNENLINEVRTGKNTKFIGYSFDGFKFVLEENIKKPFEFENAPQGFFTFELNGNFYELDDVLNWAEKYEINARKLTRSMKFLVIQKRS
jgi:hypothetical protein